MAAGSVVGLSKCPRPKYETILTSIVGGLINEGRMPPGAIIDAGAFMGEWACFYAQQDRKRHVIALDPDLWLVHHMRRTYGSSHPNLNPMHGALGASSISAVHRAQSHLDGFNIFKPKGSREWYDEHQNGTFSFPSFTIDELFESKEPTVLGFASLDLEGHELQALKGGRHTILRDLPVLTTEVWTHHNPEKTKALLMYTHDLGYDSFLIEEVCGMRADMRNVLHIPRKRAHLFVGSHVLDMAISSKVLFAVNANTILKFAFPCCARGRECCPGPDHRYCCTHWRVHMYLNRVITSGGEDIQRFTRTSWYDEKWHVWGAHGSVHVRKQVAESLANNVSRSGFYY